MALTVYVSAVLLLCIAVDADWSAEIRYKRGIAYTGSHGYGEATGGGGGSYGYEGGETGHAGEGSYFTSEHHGHSSGLGASSSVSVGGISVGLETEEESNIGATIITKKIPVIVPRPYIVEVEKKVPYVVKVPVEIPVPKPYQVPVPRPYHVEVEKKVPVTVEKPVPYIVKVPVRVDIPHAVPVSVPKPYVVEVPKAVKVPVAKPIIVPKAVPVYLDDHHHGGSAAESYANSGGEENYGSHQ